MTHDSARSAGRLHAVRILAIVMAVSAIGFGLFTAVFGIVSPAQEPHAFHNVVVASLLIVLSAPPVVAVALAPEHPIRPLVVLAVVGVAALATMALSATIDPFTLPFVILVAVLWALTPSRTELVPAWRPSLMLLALFALGAVPLVWYALGQAELQRTDHASEHAAFFHWVETSFYAVAVLLVGLLAAQGPAAYRLAGWCAGLALAILGAASLGLAAYASALPMPWSWVALLGGVLFVGATEWEARRTEAFATS
jgi:hypothetical protein